jgi:hypothetical protein
MGDAFDRSLELLNIAPSAIVQEAMANRIIEAVHRGERDAVMLRDTALMGMGSPREC